MFELASWRWPWAAPRCPLLLLLLLLLVTTTQFLTVVPAYRILSAPNDPEAAKPAVFEPYVHGNAGYYGDPANFGPERVDEGAPFSPDTPRIYFAASPKQNCPGMIGPIRQDEYYCRGREYGFCDRRNGLCICNEGYTGIDCTQCKPSYFQKGNLCYPKKSCPKDCSRAGVCDYESGTCTCVMNRRGVDCSQVFCGFDPKCTSCTATQCQSCIPGYYVDPATQKCVSCTMMDPRCIVCDVNGCLQCADPILNSIRRSGARNVDAPLPFDELDREFSFKFSYGSQDPRVFDEAEPFQLVPTISGTTAVDLNASSMSCVQGTRLDASWTCTSFHQSHRVCGHLGVFYFTSPIYAVPETAQSIMLTVRRSGGGMGNATVMYELIHNTTSGDDVSPTAFYTSSQTLHFTEGIVELSFLLTIHDDHVLEGDESFRVFLRSPSIGSSLGNQREAHVTILEDDSAKTDASLTNVIGGSGTTLAKGGHAGDALSFQIQAVLGSGAAKTTGGDVLVMESYVADESDGELAELSTVTTMYRSKMLGQIVDLNNGKYTCNWQRAHAGLYTVAVYLLYPGGLRGDYYADAWFDGSPVISRIDRHVNFTWDEGPLFTGASDYITVRWAGRVKPKATGEITFYVDCDDHVRLWIGDLLLMDRWSIENDGGVSASAAMDMDSTILYPIVLEYRELTGDAQIALSWSGATFQREVIPQAYLYSSQHILGSPFANVPILPALSASPTTTYLEGVFSTTAGIPMKLDLYPVDANGNPRLAFDPKVDVYEARLTVVTDQSLGGNGPKQVACDVVWEQQRRGVFAVTCLPYRSGTHGLDILINAVKITGCPFTVTVASNQMHPTRSILSGNGLTGNRIAGVPTTVALETRDLNGNRIYTGGKPKRLELRAVHTTATTPLPTIEVGTVVDNGDGTYAFTYTPRIVGTYLVQVTTNGVHIHNSPYTVTTIPNVPVGPTSVATGAGLTVAVTNVQSSFQIQARDLNANDVNVGGATYQVILQHPTLGNVTGTCLDLATGKYTCTYTPKYVGSSLLHVGLSSGGVFKPVPGSPFALEVIAGSAKGSLCFAQGSALVASIAGQVATFTVFIRDNFNNDKLNAGAEAVTVSFQGPTPATTMVPAADAGVVATYSGNGQFLVSYRLTAKGQYLIQVKVDGLAILGSPFTMYTYPAEAAYATTSIDLLSPTSDAISPLTYIAGTRIFTRITSRDAFGNVLETGGYRFEVAPELADSALVQDARFVDEQNGSYRFDFTPTRARVLDLAPRLMRPGGLNATYYASPDLTGPEVLKRIDPAMDFAYGTAAPAFDDAMETFSVRWRGYVLPRYSEIYTFKVKVVGGVRGRVDGQWLFAELFPEAATQEASATIYLTGNRLVPIEWHFAKPRAFPNAGIRVLWSSMSQPEEVIPPTQLFTGWSYVNNVPTINVVPDRADPRSFTASLLDGADVVGGTLTATAGEPLVFHVTARDRFGNRRLEGGDRLFVLFPQLPSDVQPHPNVRDLENATYVVSFTPSLSGDFAVIIATTRVTDAAAMHPGTGLASLIRRLDSYGIHQSPFVLRVAPNRPLASASTVLGRGVYAAMAGEPTSFLLELRDLHANLVEATPELVRTLTIELSRIEDQQRTIRVPTTATALATDGRVQVNYTATIAGHYEIRLAIAAEPAVTKTSSLRVFPNAASSLTSTASGLGLGPQVIAARPQSFLVDARDVHRNDRERGGDHLAVDIVGPETVAGEVRDLGTGQYIVTYTPPVPGTYEIRTVLANPGRGLVGRYFENTRFAGLGLGVGRLEVDPVIDFDWRTNASIRAFPRIRWQGFLVPRFTERYTLTLVVWPLAAVYVDGTAVVDALNEVVDANDPDDQAARVVEGDVELVGGRLHRLAIEYRSPSRRAIAGRLQLRWRSARQPDELIPPELLIPDGEELQPRHVIRAVLDDGHD